MRREEKQEVSLTLLVPIHSFIHLPEREGLLQGLLQVSRWNRSGKLGKKGVVERGDSPCPVKADVSFESFGSIMEILYIMNLSCNIMSS